MALYSTTDILHLHVCHCLNYSNKERRKEAMRDVREGQTEKSTKNNLCEISYCEI